MGGERAYMHEILSLWACNIVLVIPVIATWELFKWAWKGLGKW